ARRWRYPAVPGVHTSGPAGNGRWGRDTAQWRRADTPRRPPRACPAAHMPDRPGRTAAGSEPAPRRPEPANSQPRPAGHPPAVPRPARGTGPHSRDRPPLLRAAGPWPRPRWTAAERRPGPLAPTAARRPASVPAPDRTATAHPGHRGPGATRPGRGEAAPPAVNRP